MIAQAMSGSFSNFKPNLESHSWNEDGPVPTWWHACTLKTPTDLAYLGLRKGITAFSYPSTHANKK
jgi:hypothetical protein